jgi:hypothetical protein
MGALGQRRGLAMSRLDRITSDPLRPEHLPRPTDDPCGLRYPVEHVLELLASGMSVDEVTADHPDLEHEDLLAAIEFGALAAGQRRIVPLGAA